MQEVVKFEALEMNQAMKVEKMSNLALLLVLALCMSQPLITNASWFTTKRYVVHIENRLSNHTLQAHCTFADQDLGVQPISMGEQFQWVFYMTFWGFWGHKVNICNLSWPGGYRTFAALNLRACDTWIFTKKVTPGFQLGLLDSVSNVLTTGGALSSPIRANVSVSIPLQIICFHAHPTITSTLHASLYSSSARTPSPPLYPPVSADTTPSPPPSSSATSPKTPFPLPNTMNTLFRFPEEDDEEEEEEKLKLLQLSLATKRTPKFPGSIYAQSPSDPDVHSSLPPLRTLLHGKPEDEEEEEEKIIMRALEIQRKVTAEIYVHM
ncbi:hypothetical protein FH972_004994 [Carpinus fangiana]|uniref:S-protein homolog n=1 Tax=Carpinus fangiana TaxID=176857 RepID=A0A5N6QPR3_9ROSI|nr:hypothetical protein FH972_004994 [Carpinus fangiana]